MRVVGWVLLFLLVFITDHQLSRSSRPKFLFCLFLLICMSNPIRLHGPHSTMFFTDQHTETGRDTHTHRLAERQTDRVNNVAILPTVSHGDNTPRGESDSQPPLLPESPHCSFSPPSLPLSTHPPSFSLLPPSHPPSPHPPLSL